MPDTKVMALADYNRLVAERNALAVALAQLVCGDPTCERCALGYAALEGME